VDVLSSKELEKKGYGLICAVGNSNGKKGPRMAVVYREGSAKGKTIAVVGKGVTFDTGGYAIKPLRNMRDMKYDKIGGVYGAHVLYQLVRNSSLNEHTLIGVFPFAENLISSTAVRPGDVVTSFIGKTVEISNPDAEGRLLLADAFGHLHGYKPDVVLDVATLTGHAEKISCYHYGYFYALPARWGDAIEKSSDELGERMIAMPTWTDVSNTLQSPVADLSNSGATCSDSFTATMFLKQFLPSGCDWLHIDLAHGVDREIPTGDGIRTMMSAVHLWLDKK
jgi:leucyl aminopeptidase